MINNKKILAIIPARGGSKRLPRKNILPLAGKPLIQWTIEAALNSKYLDTVMVSTDCSEIASISKSSGADIPFIRSAVLANDVASSIDVVLDTIFFYEANSEEFDYIILLQPTSPLRTSQDIDSAIEMLIEKSASGIISVTECEHSPLWCNTLPDTLSFNDFISKDLMSKRSQDLATYYRLNGAIYLVESAHVKNFNNFFPRENVFSYIMDKSHSVDIDDEFDFQLAELLVENVKSL